MDQKIPIITKKVWSLVRVMFFMLKKNISKRKLLVDLNMMMKRGKIARKSLHKNRATPLPGEYEFSCNNNPPYPLALFSARKKRNQDNGHFLANLNPPLALDDCDDITIDPSVIKVLNMVTSDSVVLPLPGFKTSPMVEQSNIKDSTFPVAQGLEDGQVDEAAEKFIRRFYNDLRQQNK